MTHLILTGATGRAGAAILVHALRLPTISRISIISRRPVKLAETDPRVHVIVQDDFGTYSPETLAQLRGASGCIWALGISAFGMSEAEYTRITYDYTIAAAKAFAGLSENKFIFVFMSGEGASVDGKGQLFARVKGRTEKTMLELVTPNFSIYNIRPGAIDSEGEHLAERKPNANDRMLLWAAPILNLFWKKMIISTDCLARAALALALGNGDPLTEDAGIEMGGRLIRNTALRRRGALED